MAPCRPPRSRISSTSNSSTWPSDVPHLPPTPQSSTYNPVGVVHAGFAATLVDSAMGAAEHSTPPAGAGYTTLETKFNLVRPISLDTGQIICTGQLVHRGTRVCTAEARLTSARDHELLAHGTSTCLIIRHAGPAR